VLKIHVAAKWFNPQIDQLYNESNIILWFSHYLLGDIIFGIFKLFEKNVTIDCNIFKKCTNLKKWSHSIVSFRGEMWQFTFRIKHTYGNIMNNYAQKSKFQSKVSPRKKISVKNPNYGEKKCFWWKKWIRKITIKNNCVYN